MVWTVPYESRYNPIESVWVVAKHFAASRASDSSTLTSIRCDLMTAFHGKDGSDHKGTSPEFVQKCIGSTKRWAADWIRSSPRLQAVLMDVPAIEQSLESLTPARRASYGPIAAAHRTMSSRKAKGNGCDEDVDDEGAESGEDESGEAGDDMASAVLVPPAASYTSAPTSCSASTF